MRCSVEGCDHKYKGKGYCQMHLIRLKNIHFSKAKQKYTVFMGSGATRKHLGGTATLDEAISLRDSEVTTILKQLKKGL